MGSICGISIAKHVILMTIFLALNFTQIIGLQILSSNSESGRLLAESDNVSKASRRLDRTVRVDPLDNLKKYRGGYDITNQHYWSSTAFTGIHEYVIAVICLLCGLGYGVFLLVNSNTSCNKSSRKLKKRSLCHKKCFLQPLLFAIRFTLLAIIACGIVVEGDSKFHCRAKTVIDVIIDAAEKASDTIHNTTGAMKDMNSSLTQVDGSSKATEFLTLTSQRLDSQATNIERQAYKNRDLIDKGLNFMYGITTVTISLTMVVVIALLAFGVLKFHRTLQVLIVLCWIFTILCWFFFGIYFFLQNFAGDTCMAIEGFQQNPYNNSFSSILPCDELLSAKSVLTNVSAGIHDFLNKVNGNIYTSYGNILQICNPFSSPPMYEYQPWDCPPTSTQIGDVPQVLRMLACPDSEGETCNGGILIPANYYNTVEPYSTSIQTLLDAYPGMENLVQCQTIKDAFTEILHKHCKPLERYVRIIWTALVFLALVLVALVLIWTIGADHEQNHHSLTGSVNPNYADVIERGTSKPTNNSESGPNQ